MLLPHPAGLGVVPPPRGLGSWRGLGFLSTRIPVSPTEHIGGGWAGDPLSPLVWQKSLMSLLPPPPPPGQGKGALPWGWGGDALPTAGGSAADVMVPSSSSVSGVHEVPPTPATPYP